MNVAAAVVRNSVGKSMMRAKPTQTTMKRTAPTRPMIRPASRAKMTTVMVMTMKRPRGKPVRAIWDAMNDYKSIRICGHDKVRAGWTASYSQHGLLSRKFGDLGHELVPPLRWEYAVDPC